MKKIILFAVFLLYISFIACGTSHIPIEPAFAEQFQAETPTPRRGGPPVEPDPTPEPESTYELEEEPMLDESESMPESGTLPALSPAQIFADNVDAVFSIYVLTAGGNYHANGSGFFICPTGIAVTNHHVMVGWSSAQILTGVGDDSRQHRITGFYSFCIDNDLAVIQVDAAGAPFPYLTIGDDGELRVGDSVFAISSPRGDQNTFTDGRISREVSGPMGISNHERTFTYWIENMLQITAPIYGGSSGGALLNEMGQVIGITTAECTERPSVGFAVRISQVDLTGTQGGQTFSLPITFDQSGQVSPPTPVPGGVVGYYHFPFVPSFDSVSQNSVFNMAGTPGDLGVDFQYYEFIYVYNLAAQFIDNDIADYRAALVGQGFIFQREYTEGDVTMIAFYSPARDFTVLISYSTEGVVLIALGSGNIFG